MKAVLQRSLQASVRINHEVVGQIEKGFVVLIGFHRDDDESKLSWMVEKILNLRVFSDENGKMNLDISQVKGSLLIVSQFTLYANVNGGRRPDFLEAMKPDQAIPLYEKFIEMFRQKGVLVETGTFGAEMQINLINDGPVTILIEK